MYRLKIGKRWGLHSRSLDETLKRKAEMEAVGIKNIKVYHEDKLFK